MSKLRERVQMAGTSVPAPDLWPSVIERAEEIAETEWVPEAKQAGAPSRIGAVLVAVAASVATLVVLVLAFRGGSEVPPGSAAPVSPGGTQTNGKIAFVRGHPVLADGALLRSSVYAVDATGKHPSPVGVDVNQETAPSWSPDGSRLAIVKKDLFVVSIDDGTRTKIVGCPSSTCSGMGAAQWSPDGTSLAFWADLSNQEGLWIVPAGGGDPRLLRAGISSGQPSFSPDGSLLAVAGSDSGDPANSLLIMDADTGQILRKIAPPGLSIASSVSWDLSGESIAFDVIPDKSHPFGGIFTVHPDGSSLTDLKVRAPGCSDPGTCEVLGPSWSPDGRLIVYTLGLPKMGSDGLVGDIWVLNVETGDSRPVTSDPTALDCCTTWQGIP